MFRVSREEATNAQESAAAAAKVCRDDTAIDCWSRDARARFQAWAARRAQRARSMYDQHLVCLAADDVGSREPYGYPFATLEQMNKPTAP